MESEEEGEGEVGEKVGEEILVGTREEIRFFG